MPEGVTLRLSHCRGGGGLPTTGRLCVQLCQGNAWDSEQTGREGLGWLSSALWVVKPFRKSFLVTLTHSAKSKHICTSRKKTDDKGRTTRRFQGHS